MAVNTISNPQEAGRGSVFERHFSPEDLAELWGLSADTLRRLFENEPGVLVIERSKAPARRYRTLRIPESVALRVHRRLTNPVARMGKSC
jgi:transcriptional regulator GlxA family with amidase domain